MLVQMEILKLREHLKNRSIPLITHHRHSVFIMAFPSFLLLRRLLPRLLVLTAGRI